MKMRTLIQVPGHTTFDAFDEVVEKLRERGYPEEHKTPEGKPTGVTWTLELTDGHEGVFEFKEAMDEVQPVLDSCGYDHLGLDNPEAWETVAY